MQEAIGEILQLLFRKRQNVNKFDCSFSSEFDLSRETWWATISEENQFDSQLTVFTHSELLI